jgi:uncharacterized protein (TIGR02598 family)
MPEGAFSLVEVVLAIGVVAFAFVAILGLLPAGMTQFRQAIDTTVCAQIAQRVIGDAQQTEFDTLIDKQNLPSGSSLDHYTFRAPKVTSPEIRYFDERGGEVIPAAKAARSNPDLLSPAERTLVVYHVNVRVMPQSPVPKTIGGTSGGQELATLTIQVANNPGNIKLPISTAANDAQNDGKRQLFLPRTGTTILTYSAQIARNQ